MRPLHQPRPDYAMHLCVLWTLLLLVAGHIAVLVFVGTHIWAIFLAYQAQGMWASVCTFVLPSFSQAYWMYYWPEVQSAVWPHTLQPLPGRNWFVWFNWFWMLTFALVGFFATLAPTMLPRVMQYTRRFLCAVRPTAEKMWFSIHKIGLLLVLRFRRWRNNQRKP